MRKIFDRLIVFVGSLEIKKDQLSFDLSILFSIVFYQILTKVAGKTVTQMLSPAATLFLCMFFLLILSMSCGYLHMLYARQRRIWGYLTILVTVFLMMFPLTVMSRIADAGDLGMIATFLTGTGFVMGRIIAPDKMALTIKRYVLLLLLVPASVGLIFWMISFTGDEGYKGVLICVLGFAAVAGLGFIIHKLFSRSETALNNFFLSPNAKGIAKFLIYFFWCVAAFAICTWQEVLTDAPQDSGFYRIFILTLSGIIPYRILWAFIPPRKLATTIIATVVLVINMLFVYMG